MAHRRMTSTRAVSDDAASPIPVRRILAPFLTMLPATLFLAIQASAIAQPTFTTISDTLPGSGGQAANGQINVSWTQFTYGVYTVAQSPVDGVNYPILNGVVSIPLVPTDMSAAPVTYKIVATFGGNAVTTYWRVPTLPSGQCVSVSSCKVSEVTVAFPAGPTTVINPSQISTSGSSPGQFVCNSNGIVGWCSSPGGGGYLGNNEIPSGTVNGTNATFTLMAAPNPALSLILVVDGRILMQGSMADYTLSGNTITFNSGAIPEMGASVQAWYSPNSTATGAVIPTGAINSSNVVFTLPSVPSPPGSLLLVRNGLVQQSGGDFSLSGATITFINGVVPQTTDTLQAWYAQ